MLTEDKKRLLEQQLYPIIKKSLEERFSERTSSFIIDGSAKEKKSIGVLNEY